MVGTPSWFPTGRGAPVQVGTPARVPPTPETEAEASETRFARAAANIEEPAELTPSDIRHYLEENGVDLQSFQVVTLLAEGAFDNLSMAELELFTGALASNPETSTRVATEWQSALEASGFESQAPFDLTPIEEKLGTMEGINLQTLIPRYVQQEETGWLQYKSGVLVNPSDGTVVYQPGSDAPGSPGWLSAQRTSWSEERVEEERKKLIEMGYLEPEDKKGGWDIPFEAALANYHYQRYLHNGDPISMDATGGAGAASEIGLTAKDFQAQIRNDVRAQFTRVYGDEPSDEELESWSDFITRTSVRLQRRYVRKGETSSAALSAAATESEERFIERIEQSPEAVFIRENYTENTRLRDQIEQGVIVANSLMGS